MVKIKFSEYAQNAWLRLLKLTGTYKYWAARKKRQFDTARTPLMLHFYQQIVAPEMLCFDVGANLGSRVKIFLALGAKVVAIEPQHSCVEVLKQKFPAEKITIIQKGLGAKKETRDFFISDNSSISSFNTEWIANMKKLYQKRNWNKIEKVEITTLDDLIDSYGLPDFIKIDTEGFENEVLKGLSHKVPALSFEYTLPFHKQQAIYCLQTLHKLYGDNASYNISRDEEYAFHFPEWQNNQLMQALIESEEFNPKLFGLYGDVYVKMR